jgi:thiol-disulfide isomerase/thioredoxin
MSKKPVKEEGTCLVTANSREELEKLKSSSPFVNVAFVARGCPHCQKILPVLESECKKIKQLTSQEVAPTVVCPVDKDFCAVEMTKEALKDSLVTLYDKDMTDEQKRYMGSPAIGVPYIAGFPRSQEKVFVVRGADEEKIKKTYSTLGDMIKSTSKKMAEKVVK